MRDQVMENCRPGQQLAAGRFHLQVNDPLKKGLIANSRL